MKGVERCVHADVPSQFSLWESHFKESQEEAAVADVVTRMHATRSDGSGDEVYCAACRCEVRPREAGPQRRIAREFAHLLQNVVIGGAAAFVAPIPDEEEHAARVLELHGSRLPRVGKHTDAADDGGGSNGVPVGT